MRERRAERARAAVLATFALLALTLVAWYGSALSPAAATVAVLLTVVPLAAPLPGLVLRRRRSYRWAPLTLAPAMTWALTELVANEAVRPFALAAGLLAFGALAAIVAWLRAGAETQ